MTVICAACGKPITKTLAVPVVYVYEDGSVSTGSDVYAHRICGGGATRTPEGRPDDN